MVLIVGQTNIYNITLKVVLSDSYDNSYGNSAPENELSIHKYLTGIHGCSLGESSIVTLQFANHGILHYSSIIEIAQTTAILDNFRESRNHFFANPETKC